MNDLTGNGIVNNGPENELSGLGRLLGRRIGGGQGAGEENAADVPDDPDGPEPVRRPGGDAGLGERLQGDAVTGPAGGAFPPGGPSGDGSGVLSDGPGGMLGGDELALRRLLHGAVQDLEPSDGALDHLRKAVPTRRARKRQALVGMAAAALLFGTAIPAFVHVAHSGSITGERASAASQPLPAPGRTGAGKDTDQAAKDPRHPTGGPGATGTGGPGEKEDTDQTQSGAPGGGSSDHATGPSDTHDASTPPCDPDQLGVTAETQAPDAGGKVYGSFHVSNVSSTECSVTGSGTIAVVAAGAADDAKITVVEHTAGDAATGLPDPSQEAAGLLLAPATAYEVKFAWVPSGTCPAPTAPDPTVTSDSPADTDEQTGEPGGSGTDTQLDTDNGDGSLDGSVSVSHVAEPGAPSAETTIPDACAGTVYRTGVLAP